VGAAASLPAMLVLYVAGLTANALLARGSTMALQRLSTDFALHLRDRIHRAVLGADWMFLTRRRTTAFTHLLSDEVDRAAGGVRQLLSVATGVVLTALYVVLAFQVSPEASALALASGAVLLLLLRRPMRASRRAGVARSTAIGRLFHATGEHFGGLKTARSYGAEERHAAAFGGVTDALAESEIAAVRSWADLRAAFTIGSALLLGGIVYTASAILVLPPAGLLVLIVIFARLLPRFSTLQQSWQQFLHAVPAVERIEAELERLAANAEWQGPAVAAPALDRDVRLERVTFVYDGDEGDGGVYDLSLVIPARSTVALVGPSGAGKSTVADLVLGLLRPQSGRVTIDGDPLAAAMRTSWRARIGYVGQESFLLDSSIADNLRLARPDATDDALWEALELAAAGFVRVLPRGLETEVGERGVRLSGGERQRLSLARALLRCPDLLILDEATSALDAENESRIRRAVEGLRGRMAVLVISHRAAMVEGADRTYFLENGRLAGERSAGDDVPLGGPAAAQPLSGAR
jgi:ATP-binding cassette, subfamily C, bacterial